jgi:NHLM bacteriocin system ABC transporter ATP-binding protein
MLHNATSIFIESGSKERHVDGRDHMDLGSEPRALAVAAGMVSVFVARRRPDGTPGRRVYLGTVAPGGVLPSLLTHLQGADTTLVAVPDGRAKVVTAPARGPGVEEAITDGTDAFARVMLPIDARFASERDSDPLRRLLEYASEIAAADAAAMADAARGRSQQSAALRDRYARMLGSVFADHNEVLSIDPHVHPLLRACRHVAVEAGVPLASIPRRIPDDSMLASAESFAQAARIGCRHVQLTDEWWKGNFGPLLVTALDGTPVALVPGRWSGYRAFMYLPEQPPQLCKVDAKQAALLHRAAVVFAPPLPVGTVTLRALFAFLLRGSAHDLWLAALVSLVASVLNLLIPFATGLLVSRVIPGGDPVSLLHLGLVLASTLFAVAACELVTRFLLLRTETRATMRGSSSIILRALQLPLSFFQKYSVGDLAQRLGVIEEVQRRVTGTMVVSVVSGVFSLTYLVLMAAIDPFAAAVSALLFLVVFTLTALVAGRQARFAADAAERSGKLSGFSLQLLDGIDRIRTTGTEEHALLQWLHRYRPERRAMYGAAIVGAQLRVLAVAVPFAAAAFLWWRFGAIAGGKEVQVPAFMAFNAAFLAALAAITSFGYAIGDISEIAPLMGRLLPILEERAESDPAAESAGQLSGSLSIQDIRFAYAGSAEEVLRGVSIEVAAGDFIAIVGASGSGKSTLAQLLLGLRRPTAGKVLFDGKDLAKLDLVSVRRQIGVVGQHARVIPGTMLENIVGATLLSKEDAWAAAEAAGFAEDIREMPMQMSTFVNEHTLSGGQLQKLLIARALVTQPRILVLDEATSALDEVSQACVSRSLEERKVTRIVIAHRLSTVRAADCIYVLSGGEVVQTGRFDDLASAEGPFRELVRRQLLELPVSESGGSA